MRLLLSWLLWPFRLIARLSGWIARTVGLLLVVCAFASLVVDGSRSIANETLVLTPAGKTWYDVDRDSIGLAQAVVQRYTFPFIWDPVVQTALTWPTAAVLGVPGLILLVVGRRRRRR